MPDPTTSSGSPRVESRSEWTAHLRQRLASLRLHPAREAEIVEELSQHLDERYDELRRDGTSEAEALRLAIDELLEPEALSHHMRSLRQATASPPFTPGEPRVSLFRDTWPDLRYASRLLRREPGFAAAAVLTLALGIGANNAIFALVDATLLRPLPFPGPERIVMIWERTEQTPRGGVSPLNLVDWNDRNRTFEVIAGFLPNVGGMVLGGTDGTPDTIPRQWVTAGVFDALGIKPIIGRTFLPSDDTQRTGVVVLAEAFWRARFNADPGVVGRELRLDGSPYAVVGVVPQEAQLLGRTSIWALASIQGLPAAARGQHFLQAIGRVKAGVALEAARADMAAVSERLAKEFPGTNTGRGVTIEPMRDAVIGSELRQTAMLFLAVVGFVLLICCANAASLLLVRATARRRELAVRYALGADRRRVVRQLVTESLVLAAMGGAVGLGIGAAILAVAPSLMPPQLLPAAVTLTVDARVIAFCAVTALLVGMLFGLAPAWQASEFSPVHAIASDGRATTGRGGRIRTLLVIGQVATAVMLLFGAGLLLRTLLAVDGVDRGYRAESVLTMIVDPMSDRYPTDAAELQFYEAVEQEVMALPGIRSVAWATTLPLGRSYEGPWLFEIVGDPPSIESQRPVADYQIVSPAYFTTLDLPIVAGRAFDERDDAASVPVCIVNEAFVRAHLQSRSPIGLRVSVRPTGSAPPAVREIVGVARQVKGRPDEIEDLIQIYVPVAQDTPGDIFMLVRPAADQNARRTLFARWGSGRAEALAPAVRAAIGRVDTEQLVSVRSVMTLDDVAWEATARYRFRAVLVTAFAGLALLLAMVGLFGTLAYSVQQRVPEFGVRRALGATTGDVLRLVAGSAMRVIATGAAIGLALSVILGRLLTSMLFDVQPLDPTTLVYVAAVVALTAIVSIVGPAWRAAHVDPAVALRRE